MALAEPISLPNLLGMLRLDYCVARLEPQQERSGLGSGETIYHDVAPALWEFDMRTPQAEFLEVERWKARLQALDGGRGTFLVTPMPIARQPATDPARTLLASSTVQVANINANRKEVAFKGLPPGFVLPWGTYASISYGSGRRALVQLLTSAGTDEEGVTGQAEVRPHLRPGVTPNDAVALIDPVAKAQLVPGSVKVEIETLTTARLSFSARQTLAAD